MKGKVIYKYQLGSVPIAGRYEIKMPKGAKVLTVENQNEKIVVYAIVDMYEKKQKRHIFYAYSTGQPIIPKGKFLGTFMFYDGINVKHIFHHKESLLDRLQKWLYESGGD